MAVTRAIAIALIAVLLGGCATIQHPNAPGVQYASMAVCQSQNPDEPQQCAEVIHQQATNQAVTVFANLLLVLSVVGLIAYVMAGGR
jgi:uncharacterized protein YceK